MDKTSIKQTRRLEELNKIVSLQGGKCLSCIYKNSATPLEWECKRGHTWMMKPSYVKDGSWCKKCKKNDILKGMKKYARSRGGRCLSKQFVNSKTKLLWQCNSGHTWYSNSAKYNNSWCPYCAKSVFISEAKCRFIFETLTGHEFKTNRSILNGLELDGYCEDLKTAFEFHGQQHFEFIQYFHKKTGEFVLRQKRDLKKIRLCDIREISLLIIPYWKNSSDDNLVFFIRDWLIAKKIAISEWNDKYWKIFYKSFVSILDNLQNMASKKNGKLLSAEYHGASIPLKWQCEHGHIWQKTPAGIQQGHWCPKCNARAISKRNRNSIADVRNLANKNSSTLISRIYEINIIPLEWRCNICHNHWNSTLNAMKTRLLKGKWCLFCQDKEGVRNACK